MQPFAGARLILLGLCVTIAPQLVSLLPAEHNTSPGEVFYCHWSFHLREINDIFYILDMCALRCQVVLLPADRDTSTGKLLVSLEFSLNDWRRLLTVLTYGVWSMPGCLLLESNFPPTAPKRNK
jgi:hypothetical protein